jgi:two-component system, NarL family, invasion response regulator UvrY
LLEEVRDRLAEWAPNVKVIILALDRDDHRISRAMEAGARRYLTKDTGPEEILRMIRDVHEG